VKRGKDTHSKFKQRFQLPTTSEPREDNTACTASSIHPVLFL
jgi:hypothetical protein